MSSIAVKLAKCTSRRVVHCGELAKCTSRRVVHCGELADDEELPLLPGHRGAEEESSDSEEKLDRPMPRRSGRTKRFPDHYGL